jgi:hypothetical protein
MLFDRETPVAFFEPMIGRDQTTYLFDAIRRRGTERMTVRLFEERISDSTPPIVDQRKHTSIWRRSTGRGGFRSI